MARKSKRMALNEAIRQEQAKIAEGLKTGQIRSDGPFVQKDEEAPSHPECVMGSPVNKCWAFVLKSKEKSMILGRFSPKMKLMALLCAALIVVLALGIWLIFLIGTGQPSQAGGTGHQRTPVAGVAPEEKGWAERKFRLPDLGSGDSSGAMDKTPAEKESLLPPLSGGSNVIWIQSIAMSRKAELDSLRSFFRSKGIPTEIIEIRNSGLAVLVTQDGFESNPSTKGTAGNELLERIKQLGAVYVEETKDTKFGVEPFQDALGYKRE
ncbi:MAG: hypothetical protein B6I25_07275 [Planctomycetales bacterium 4572_13]|nr:MAG: hypothetical protein B6I25_07275 [Planctomycetales bacterium 4572_13]